MLELSRFSQRKTYFNQEHTQNIQNTPNTAKIYPTPQI